MTYHGLHAFYEILTVVKTAIISELKITPGGEPKRAGVVPGAVAWDECEGCGTLALTATRYFLTNSFPIEVNTTSEGLGGFLAADCNIVMLRCAPQPQGTALAPPVSALDATAKLVGEDAFTIMCATITVLNDLKDQMEIVDFMIRQQLVRGPEGACVGSDLSVVIGVEW